MVPSMRLEMWRSPTWSKARPAGIPTQLRDEGMDDMVGIDFIYRHRTFFCGEGAVNVSLASMGGSAMGCRFLVRGAYRHAERRADGFAIVNGQFAAGRALRHAHNQAVGRAHEKAAWHFSVLPWDGNGHAPPKSIPNDLQFAPGSGARQYLFNARVGTPEKWVLNLGSFHSSQVHQNQTQSLHDTVPQLQQSCNASSVMIPQPPGKRPGAGKGLMMSKILKRRKPPSSHFQL